MEMPTPEEDLVLGSIAGEIGLGTLVISGDEVVTAFGRIAGEGWVRAPFSGVSGVGLVSKSDSDAGAAAGEVAMGVGGGEERSTWGVSSVRGGKPIMPESASVLVPGVIVGKSSSEKSVDDWGKPLSSEVGELKYGLSSGIKVSKAKKESKYKKYGAW